MLNDDPDHAIVDQPWTYQVVELRYSCEPDGWEKSYIDIVLERDGIVRRLRFHAPRSLRIDEGFPRMTSLHIRDVAHRQMAGIGVWVGDDEQHGGLAFWARDVIDLGTWNK